MKRKFLIRIFITVFLLNSNSVFAAEENNNLINCLSTQSKEIEKKTQKAISIALKCMSSYVSEVDKKIEIEEIKSNLKLPQYYINNPLPYQTNLLDINGKYTNNLNSLPINLPGSSNGNSRYFVLPGFTRLGSEDDGSGDNVYYGSGVFGAGNTSGNEFNTAVGF